MSQYKQYKLRGPGGQFPVTILRPGRLTVVSCESTW
jgi:hypothetical protein